MRQEDTGKQSPERKEKKNEASICIARIGCSVECVPHSWTFVIFIHQNSARNQNSFGQKEQRECHRKKVQAKWRHTEYGLSRANEQKKNEKKSE